MTVALEILATASLLITDLISLTIDMAALVAGLTILGILDSVRRC